MAEGGVRVYCMHARMEGVDCLLISCTVFFWWIRSGNSYISYGTRDMPFFLDLSPEVGDRLP